MSDTRGLAVELTGDAGEVVEIAFAEGTTVLSRGLSVSDCLSLRL